MRRLGTAAIVVVLLSPLWVVLGILYIVGPRLRSVEADYSATVESPVWVRAIEVEEADSFPVNVEVVYDSPTQFLRSPGGRGIVTEILAEEGRLIESGSPIFAVDGVTRIAAQTPQPFHRDLSAGDSGDDVQALKELLVDLGHLDLDDAERSELFDWRTRRAVGRLASNLGESDRVSTFSREWIVWLPSSTIAAGSVLLNVGAGVPELGADVVEVARSGGRLEIAPVDPGEQLGDGTYTFDFEEFSSAATVESEAVRILDPESSSQIVERVESLGPTEGSSDGERDPVRGTLRSSEGVVMVVVPSTAIQFSSAGDACVVISEGGSGSSRRVQLGDRSAPGLAEVVDGLRAGDEVLANPSAGPEDVCV